MALEEQRRQNVHVQPTQQIVESPTEETPHDNQETSQEGSDPPAKTGTETKTAPKVVPVVRKTVSLVDTIINPQRGPAFEIQSNVNAIRYLKCLFYAEYGVGKTFLAGTSVEVPQMRDVLFLSAEAGTLTLFDPDSPIPFNLIDIVEVQDYHATARVYDFLKLHCSAREAASRGNPAAREHLLKMQMALMPNIPDPDRLRLFRTVTIDSLAEVENFCMSQLLGISQASAMDEETGVESWDEYRNQRKMIHRLIRNFRNLPMNVIFTCPRHFKETKEGTKTRTKYMPMMTGKLAHEVQGFMDLVGHYIIGNVKEESEAGVGEGGPEDVIAPRRLYVQPGPRFAAKNRFSRYKKPYWDNPTMLKIMTDTGLLEGPGQSDELIQTTI